MFPQPQITPFIVNLKSFYNIFKKIYLMFVFPIKISSSCFLYKSKVFLLLFMFLNLYNFMQKIL